MVLLWYYYGIVMVLLWYYYGIIMVLLWYYYRRLGLGRVGKDGSRSPLLPPLA